MSDQYQAPGAILLSRVPSSNAQCATSATPRLPRSTPPDPELTLLISVGGGSSAR